MRVLRIMMAVPVIGLGLAAAPAHAAPAAATPYHATLAASEEVPSAGPSGGTGTAKVTVDSATGVVMRIITRAEMKPTDFVQQEDIRVDFAPVSVSGALYNVPTRSTILTTVVPNGDAFVKFSTRRTIFDVTYTKYQPASTPTATH